MSATTLPFRVTNEAEPTASEPQPEPKGKPRRFKNITHEMVYALDITQAMFDAVPELQKYSKHIEQVRKILTFQDGWMAFHRSKVWDLTLGDGSLRCPTTMTFLGLNSLEIERMSFGHHLRWDKAEEDKADRKSDPS